ncbi:hypothetical protein ACFL21_04520 [Patescibacteria group bacterium]
MKKILILTLFVMMSFSACGGSDDKNGNGDSADSGDTKDGGTTACADTDITFVAPKASVDGFDFTESWGNYNTTYGTYRAIFTNYPKADDSDFKSMEGDEIKVSIMVYKTDGSELTPGTYSLQEDNSMAVNISSAKGTMDAASLNDEDIGFIEITHVDDEKICGTADVEDSYGLKAKGTFSLMNE